MDNKNYKNKFRGIEYQEKGCNVLKIEIPLYGCIFRGPYWELNPIKAVCTVYTVNATSLYNIVYVPFFIIVLKRKKKKHYLPFFFPRISFAQIKSNELKNLCIVWAILTSFLLVFTTIHKFKLIQIIKIDKDLHTRHMLTLYLTH